jgi:4-amino-4-deoxy-L-arabinose transferase-like glycosyltransferase
VQRLETVDLIPERDYKVGQVIPRQYSSARIPGTILATERWAAAARYRVAEDWAILALLLLALILRLTWIAFEIPIVQGDECEYLRIAENLLHEHRYAGLYEGLELVYPPLFPILIALLSLATPDIEAAGTAVGLLSGLALVAATYALARQLYGSRAGVLAATLVAVHPTLIQLSGTIISQAVYLPLVVTGVLFAVRWVEERDRFLGLLCGACFGLAYLTRPEALAGVPVIAAMFVVTARAHRSSFGKSLLQTLPMLVMAAALAAPYVAYLSIQTGAFHLEGKSVMNYTLAQRINAGMDPYAAGFAVGPDLHEDGPFLSVNRWIMEAPAAIPRRGLAEYLVQNSLRNAGPLRRTLLSPAFGGYLMIVLVATGLLFRPPGRPSFAREALVFTIVVGYVVILLGQHMVALQYVVPLLPFLMIWAANGIGIVTDWIIAGTRVVAHGHNSWRTLVAMTIPCALVLALVIPGADLSRGGAFRSDAPLEAYRKEAGLWLARRPVPPRTVMSTSNEVPYYAGATAMRLPYAPGDRALAYVRLKSPDYVVLPRQPSRVEPYYTSWLKRGIPDPAARLVHLIGAPDDPDVAIFQLGKL